jgi:hypothetical protein
VVCVNLKIKKVSKNAAFSDVSKERAVSITNIIEISQVDPELAGSRK